MAESKGRRRSGTTKIVEVPQVDQYGHKQPQSLDMEVAVLGALIVEQDSYGLVAELLKPESFYDHRHQLIYQAIQTLNAEQKPVDIMTVIEQLERTDNLEAAGGEVYLMQINAQVASSAHIEYHAKVIAQKSLQRQLITFASLVQTKAFDATIDVADLMQEAESMLFAISQKNMKKDFTQIDPIISQVIELIQKAQAKEGGLSGLPTGFRELDKITNGWQNSDLIIIAARPAMGKTAFVLSMIKRMAVDNKIPCAMFSLEMSNQQLVQRLMVNVSELSGEKLRSGQLAPYEWGQLDNRVRQLYNAPIYIDDTPSLSVFELQTKARRLVREYGVKTIMIDYLQLMHASGLNINSRQEEVSSVSRALKGLAKELNIPIIALSQLNRGVESREGIEGKRPQLSDLRESGAIEQDADIVCFIHRPEYYKIFQDEQGNDWRGKAMFIVAKHRNGSVGDIKLAFRSELARFTDLDNVVPLPNSQESDMGGRFVSPKMTPEEMAESDRIANAIGTNDSFAGLQSASQKDEF
ncbi:MAG: replicative DNA helicase [Bacteroidaceae bacterium]|nr:replicative DNA helicase [Bacteroidaceae bacterium]